MLSFEGVTHRFGDRVALDRLSFTVRTGAVVGFLGPNGAGKTTAMRTVFGILTPSEGSVHWQGRPLDDEVRHTFGYLPEERGLYAGMTVIDQLVFIGRLHGLTGRHARNEATHWLDRLGLGERLNDRIQALSLGNQQRVQVVAALLHKPRLLVLDEPFSGLDPVAVDALGEVLAERARDGVSVLFSSHQLDLVEHLCEEVVIINGGRLVVDGSVDALTSQRQRLVVEVAGVPARQWLPSIPGIEVVDDTGTRARILLHDATPAAVLAAAQRAGELAHFGFERRRLSEIFREAVAA
ncbi:MAG: ABC transporter ATP-binding protein [Acidimicrobiia bacterium]